MVFVFVVIFVCDLDEEKVVDEAFFKYSYLVLLRSNCSRTSLWCRNGRVSSSHSSSHPRSEQSLTLALSYSSAINAPANGTMTFPTFQNMALALNGTAPPTPSGALNGSGAAASLLPGPLTGGFSGAALPSGATPTPTAPASSASGSGSGAAPNPTSSTSDAKGLVVGGVVGVLSALLGVLLI